MKNIPPHSRCWSRWHLQAVKCCMNSEVQPGLHRVVFVVVSAKTTSLLRKTFLAWIVSTSYMHGSTKFYSLRSFNRKQMSYETFKATPINWAESYTSTNNCPDKLNPCLSISFTYFDSFNGPPNYWSFLWKDKLEDYRKERLLAKSVCSASNHNSARVIKPREITLCNLKKKAKKLLSF